MQKLRTALLVLVGVGLGLAAAIFVYDNSAATALNFLRWQTEPLPMWAVVAAAMVAGAVAPRLLGVGAAWRRFRDSRKLDRRLAELEAEVVRLRNIPLEALPEETVPPPVSRAASTALAPSAGRRVLSARSQPSGQDDYASFLASGEGFDAVERETYLGTDGAGEVGEDGEGEDSDPYALAFDSEEPVVEDLDASELYPAVGTRSRRSGAGR